MPVAIKRGKVQLTSEMQCRCQYGQTQQKTCTTSTLTVRNGEAVSHHFSYDRPVEKQIGLPGGLQVIRPRRYRRYRFRPWSTQAEVEEEGQYSRPMPMLHLDDPMACRNFIQMLPELYQELEQRITAEFQRDRTLMKDSMSPGVKLAVTLRHLATGDSYNTLQYSFRVASPTSLCLRSVMLSPGPIEIRGCGAPHSQICCFTSCSTARVILRWVVYRWRKPVHTAV